MFGLSTIQAYVTAAVVGVILSLSTAIWIMDGKIDDKNNEIAVGIANLATEQLAHQVTAGSFIETTEAYEVVRVELTGLNERLRDLSEVNDELEDKLARHDLEALSLAKPLLIERIINRATEDVMNRIETITGGGEDE